MHSRSSISPRFSQTSLDGEWFRPESEVTLHVWYGRTLNMNIGEPGGFPEYRGFLVLRWTPLPRSRILSKSTSWVDILGNQFLILSIYNENSDTAFKSVFRSAQLQ